MKFNRELEWNFEKLTHRKGRADYERKVRNTNLYGHWIWDLMKREYGKPLESDEIFTSTGLYMNDNNISYLREYIGDWDWLCYSPCTDNTLNDDELIIKNYVEKKL